LRPFIVGFNYSRPENNSKWSEGLNADELWQLDYHHPDYAQRQKLFCMRHDYDSLGIVLLEIGLWKTLKRCIEKLEKSLAKAPGKSRSKS
jgi:hypothetical protein